MKSLFLVGLFGAFFVRGGNVAGARRLFDLENLAHFQVRGAGSPPSLRAGFFYFLAFSLRFFLSRAQFSKPGVRFF